MLCEKRDMKAAQRIFRNSLALDHVEIPRGITVDKNLAYPVAIENLKKKAEQTIKGIETMHMIKKGQVELEHSSPLFVVQLFHRLFGLIV
jgi:transposase-like protein